MRTAIITVYHKSGFPIVDNPDYLPVQSGKAVSADRLGIQGDDEGDNISELVSFSEFRALYWAWKNLPEDIDIVGWSQYRRFFDFFGIGNRCNWSCVFPENWRAKVNFTVPDRIKRFVSRGGVVLPKRCVYSLPLLQQYLNSHFGEHYDIVKSVLAEVHGNAVKEAFIKHFERRNEISLCSMFIMNRKSFDEYCEWLFPVLFKCQDKIDFSKLDNHQMRAIAFIGERLNDFYNWHRGAKVMEIPLIVFNQELDNVPFRKPNFMDEIKSLSINCTLRFAQFSMRVFNGVGTVVLPKLFDFLGAQDYGQPMQSSLTKGELAAASGVNSKNK